MQDNHNKKQFWSTKTFFFLNIELNSTSNKSPIERIPDSRIASMCWYQAHLDGIDKKSENREGQRIKREKEFQLSKSLLTSK